MQPIQGRLVCDEITDLGGYSKAGRILAVLVGHIGHVCLAMIHAPVEPDLSRPVLRQNEPSTIFLALGEFRAKRTNSAS